MGLAGPPIRQRPPSGPRRPPTPSRPPGTPGAPVRQGVRATLGSGRRSGRTDTRRGVPRGTPATEAEASRPVSRPGPPRRRREIRRMAAISRWFRPSQYFSRRTSRILRMDNLFRAPSSSSPKDLSRGWKNGPLHQVIQHSPHPLGSTAPTSHAGQKRRRIQVDELRRNRWTLCAGISGPHPSEQVDVLCGNQAVDWISSQSTSVRPVWPPSPAGTPVW